MTDEQNIELSKYCKEQCGMDATEVAAQAEISRRTLYKWWKTRRRVIQLIIDALKTEREKGK